ncbi:MAG: calcium-translocating P-type ATPase, PMCA-type [Planctomycetota bacterium]|jgi:Ca2+-transporting ATPase|nr:calcium-translocating P-type ATPase, PMCA-type [Planctomycetota bacterium]
MSSAETGTSRERSWPGLTPAQVEESRRRHGANLLTPPERPPWWALYLEKFRDPIVRILCLAAAVAVLVGLYDGHFAEGVGIVAAILLSTWLSFVNEYRAAREFEILNRTADDEGVQVIREGRPRTVPRRDLVVGDIVLVEQGAEIPADAEILEAVSLTVNESSLTGESLPVDKRPAAPGQETGSGHAYPPHLLLRGTVIADGHAVGRVIRVGDATEIGRTARAALEAGGSPTPLVRQLEKLAGAIEAGSFLAAALIFTIMTVKGAGNGEIHAVAERAGRLVPVPLTPGQWYCFALAGASLLILGARLPASSLQAGLSLAGCATPFLSRVKGIPRGRLAAAAAVLAGGGVLAGVLLGILHPFRGELLPLPAIGAFLRYFMVAVTVVVMAVPEGLPMCVTLSLAYSMRKMTATNNLVRKLHACETIGAASVICSDKTGTLTMNEMRVARAAFPPPVSGAAPEDRQREGLFEAVAVNSTANLEKSGDRLLPLGNPTEAALLLWLAGEGRDYQALRAGFQVERQLTFTTNRKFMATAGFSGIGRRPILYLKGAPEIVLGKCRRFSDSAGRQALLTEKDREAILAEIAGFQDRGMRIIGLADGEVDPDFLRREIDPEVSELAWRGFFAISDPIRPDVPAAVDSALAAGLKIKMVTGDNRDTAREIARQAGLWRPEDDEAKLVSGDAFAALPEVEAAEAARRIKVMFRARPLHKLRLVDLLKRQGEVVAVTGDGVNDAPALNHADIGLAMGKTGTAAAKEASDIILLDDSFNSIVNAVAWGRSLYANIQRFVVFQLTINLAAVGIALLGPLTGVTLPLTVMQMLWINLIMDTFAALALASEPPDWDLMKNSPRPAGAFIVNRPMRKAILRMGLLFIALFLIVGGLRDYFPLDPASGPGRRNLTLFFTAFVALQLWNMFNAKVFGTSRSALGRLRESKGFLAMLAVIALGQVLLVQFGGETFRVVPLSLGEWLGIAILTSPVLWLGELLRFHRRQKSRRDYWVYSS